ncbi:hypothetical protein HNV12_12795 [Methanococcoides sp. SA1]|nr:hypothetical protein [Methanococcoides sp. SA1]
MADEINLFDNLLINQIIFDLIFPLIIVLVSTYLTINYQPKSNQFEKNQYLKSLKQNACINKVFQKLNNLNYHKYQSLTAFIIGTGVGLFYFSVVVIFQTTLIPIIMVNVGSIISEDVPLIISISYQSSLIPLIFIILTLAYSINCKNKTNIIHPFLVKRKIFGKIVQILRCKVRCNLWSIGNEAKPTFTDEMTLTQKSVTIFYLFSFLLGIILTVTFSIYFTTFYILLSGNEQPFTFFLKDLLGVYLRAIAVSGSWDYIFVSISLLSLTFVTFSCLLLYLSALGFFEDSKNKIISFYSKGYPFICIKTTSGTIEGKIENIFEKHFILLNDESTQKITSWSKVGIIEIKIDD